MPLLRKPLRFDSACALLLGVLVCGLGCGRQDEGKYQRYADLDRDSDKSGGPDSQVSTTGHTPAAAGAKATTDNQTAAAVARPAASAGPDAESATSADATQTGADESAGEAAGGALAAVLPQESVLSRGPFRVGRLEGIPVEAPRPNLPPREIKLLVPTNDFRAEGPDGAVRVSYDDLDLLKVLNMDPVPVDCADYMPGWLRALDGRRIRIRGFMVPPFETTGIRAFTLARDNQICCFGRFPKEYDVIETFLRKGHDSDYIQNRPFDVVGTFHIVPEADDGDLYQLYVIDDAVVIDH